MRYWLSILCLVACFGLVAGCGSETREPVDMSEEEDPLGGISDDLGGEEIEEEGEGEEGPDNNTN